MMKALLPSLCMVATLTVRAQSAVSFDLEPGTEGLRTWTGTVTGAFSIPSRTDVQPGQTDQVAWAPTSGNETRTGQPYSSPFTGSTALLFGDGMIGGNKGAGATFAFDVTKPDMAIIISAMVILQDPGHGDKNNPFFRYELVDASNRLVQCGSFSIVSAGSHGWNMMQSGFSEKELRKMNEKNADVNAFVYWRPWSASLVSLNDYVGSRMSMNVMVGDCNKGAHGGMALCDVQVLEMAIEKQGTLSCEDAAGVTLTGTPGAVNYQWSSDHGGSWSGRTITVDAAGTYTLRMTVETGSQCGVELSVNVVGAAERAASNGIATSGVLNCDSTSGVVLTAEANANGYAWSTGETTQSITVHEPGGYTVSRPGAPGRNCDQEDRVNIVADLSLPDPAFTLSAEDICEGTSVDITATPIPTALQKKVKQRYDFGDGTIAEDDVNDHTFTAPGTYVVTRYLERGQCAVPYEQPINVHPNPSPALGIAVECATERTYTFSPLGAGPSDEVWFTGTRCNGQEFAHESIGINYRAPLAADSCVRFDMKIRTPLGCEGSAQQEFTAPHDPIAGAAVVRTGGIDEFLFAVLDTSKYAEQVIWSTDVAHCTWDSLAGALVELRYDSAGTYKIGQLVIGAPFSCPDSIKLVVRVETSLTSRWGPSWPRPVRFIRTKTGRDCCGHSPNASCPCPCCTNRRKP